MTYLDKKWLWRLFYTVTPAGMIPLPHETALYLNVTDGVEPGGEFDEFQVTPRGAVALPLGEYTDTLMDLIEALYANTAQFIRAELWAANVGSEDFVFYSTLAIGHLGSSANPNQGNNSTIITFRCQNGNSMRIQLAETEIVAAPKDPYPFVNVNAAALAAHVSGAFSAVVNKRFSFPIAPINSCTEQNEHYWDARNR